MTRWLRSTCAACFVATGTLTIVPNALAQSSLGAARDLYAAAAYDDALTVLNGLRASDRREDNGLIEQYRAFCLLALGRATEADSAIEAAVTAAPLTQPSETDVSPRVRSAFRDVRRRVLPAIIEREYTNAKAAFDRKDTAAAERFTLVLALIADSDLQSIANQPPLPQLRAMATDFLTLSTPEAPPPPPLVPRRAQPPDTRPAAAPAARDVSRIYGPDDASVVPPAAARQSFAPMAEVFALRPGTVEIVVDETGTVTAAMTKVSVNQVYDRLALATAKSWRYRPAMLDGVAVKFRLVVQLQLPPRH
jgi:TonB family protein